MYWWRIRRPCFVECTAHIPAVELYREDHVPVQRHASCCGGLGRTFRRRKHPRHVPLLAATPTLRPTIDRTVL